MSDRMIELVAERFRLLGEPQRLRILQLLQKREHSVTEIVDALGANQPNISKHLQILAAAGLVERRREGNAIYYSVADPMIFRLCHLVCESTAAAARERLAEIAAPPRAAVSRR